MRIVGMIPARLGSTRVINKNLRILDDWVISFIYNKNKRGPNTLPCGTPHLMYFILDRVSLISVHCILSVR